MTARRKATKPARRPQTRSRRASRISVEDRRRHDRMVALIAEAQELEQRAAENRAAMIVWARELHDRYGLDATKGEGVMPDGTIIRAGGEK